MLKNGSIKSRTDPNKSLHKELLKSTKKILIFKDKQRKRREELLLKEVNSRRISGCFTRVQLGFISG